MKYSLVSDLHLDHPQKHIPVDAYEDLIVVAGDCANGLVGMKYLNKLRRSDHTVVACDGNHEHYANANQGRTIEQTAKRFEEEFHSILVLQGIVFIQVNGWYYVEDPALWLNWMNDGRWVGSAQDVNARADADAMYVYERLLEARADGRKAVVTTHTAPSAHTLNREYEGHFSNAWYMNSRMGNLRSSFADTILVWNHGHTHAAADEVVDGVRTICNPRGYPGENPDWKPLTVEI